jgi:hypothetical protein
MKARGLIALAIVAAALGGLLVFDARYGPSRHERAGAHARLVPPFERKAVRRISIRRQAGQAFTLLRAASPTAPAPAPDWRLETAGTPAADDVAVEDLLAAIDLAESDRVADVPASAAGLQPAAVGIEIEPATGAALSVELGRPDAAERGVYARAGNDGPVRVISRRLLELADREPAAFRDRRLFPIDPTTVTAIEWVDVAGSGELRALDGRWQNGREEWVDSARVVEALRRLSALRVDRFDVSRGKHPGVRRRLTVTADATRIALELESGGANGELTRGAEHLHVPPDAIAAAMRALVAAQARDQRLIAMAPDTVQRIELADDHARVSLRRVDGAWTFVSPKVPYAADTRAVDEWLARLASVTTETRAAGPNPRRLIVEGRFRQQVDVASPPDAYALLAPDPQRFRERTLLSFARFDVRRLQRAAGKDVEKVTTDDGTDWQAPGGAQVDAGNVGRVAGALSDLRADEFLAAPPTGEAPLRLEIDVQQPGDAKPMRHALQLWPQKDGSCVARLDGEATFKPECAACDTLRLDLLKKAD